MQKSRDTLDPAFYGEAEAAFQKALSLDAKSAPAAAGLAWVCNSRHEFAKGIEWAQKALSVDDKSQHAHALIGDAQLELGDYDEAFDHYQAAIDIRPDLASYSRAAQLLFVTGDAQRAQWLMRKAIAAGAPHAENTAWCRAQLGLMLFRTGALIPAETTVAEALREAPENYHALMAMARIKTAKQDTDGAIQCYRQALARESAHGHDSALVGLGDLYASKGLKAKADHYYRLFVGARGSGERVHRHGDAGEPAHTHAPGESGGVQLARFYADHDRNLDEALQLAQTASESFKNVFVMDTLAWCHYKKGDLKSAQKAIGKALRWNTPDAEILFHAGMIASGLNDPSAAKQYLYRALNLNPRFHPVLADVAADTIKKLAAAQAKRASAP